MADVSTDCWCASSQGIETVGQSCNEFVRRTKRDPLQEHLLRRAIAGSYDEQCRDPNGRPLAALPQGVGNRKVDAHSGISRRAPVEVDSHPALLIGPDPKPSARPGSDRKLEHLLPAIVVAFAGRFHGAWYGCTIGQNVQAKCPRRVRTRKDESQLGRCGTSQPRPVIVGFGPAQTRAEPFAEFYAG